MDRQLKHQLEHDKMIHRQLSISSVSAAAAAAKLATGRNHASVYIKTDKEQRAARKQQEQEQKQHDHDMLASVTGKASKLLSLPGEREEEEEEEEEEEGDAVERGPEINSPRDLLFVWIIHPTLAAKMCWDVFVALLIVYSVIFIPYRICFEQDSVGAAAVYVVEWWCGCGSVVVHFWVVVLLDCCTAGSMG